MEKKDFRIILFFLGIAFLLLGFLIITMMYEFPEEKFALSLTLLSVIPSIGLVLVTLLYVTTTHEILKENQLFRKRIYIEEMITKILFPILDDVKREIDTFQSRNIFFITYQKFNITRFTMKNLGSHKHYEVFYKIFTKNYPDLVKKIDVHDEKIAKFDETCSNILKKINITQFRERWIQNSNTYDGKTSKENQFPAYGKDQHSHIIDFILNSIFLDTKFHDLPDDFWNKYQNEILSERERNKKDFEYLERKIKDLQNILKDLKNDLETTINSEQEKYGILAYD